MGNNLLRCPSVTPRYTDPGPGFLPPFTPACKGGGSRQHTGLPESRACQESEPSAWLADLLEEASGWKALVEAGVGVGRETDIRQGQTGRQQPQLDTCSVGGGGLDAL